MLNTQLFNGLRLALNINGIHNCEYYSLSSALKFGDFIINKFTPESITRIKTAQKHIIVIDNFNNYYDVKLKEKNVSVNLNNPNRYF